MIPPNPPFSPRIARVCRESDDRVNLLGLSGLASVGEPWLSRRRSSALPTLAKSIMEPGTPASDFGSQTQGHKRAGGDALSPASSQPRYGLSEDVWAILLGMTLILGALVATAVLGDSLKGWVAQPGIWSASPLEAFVGQGAVPLWQGSLTALAIIAAVGIPVMMASNRREKSGDSPRFLRGFLAIAALAVAAYALAGQEVVKYFGFEYVFWALVLGLLISNTVGTPDWMRGVVRGELFIKWGLILLGAEVLLGQLLALGLPGILVSWVVTPIVLITTFWLGCHVLKIPSPSLVMVVAADMSVCGVSAAIATAAACRAKKAELSMAIGLSLAFTSVMLVAMPLTLRYAGVDDIVGGAWIGGTIDSTGAVTAAGKAMGDRAMKIATTVKMIQNILIGVIAFAVSVYWAARYEQPGDKDAAGHRTGSPPATKPGLMAEVWKRFPKFVLGFLAASLIASCLAWSGPAGEALAEDSVDGVTKHLRNWLFCLAFVCIGLETHVKSLLPALSGGKAVVLYIVGQTINLTLTGLAAYLVFGWLFRDAIESWLQ